MSVSVAEKRRTFPRSVQPGIPMIKPPQIGAKRYIFGDLFEVVQRPVKLNDAEEYDLVTVKRARGGIRHRARMKGSQVAVKSQFYLKEGDFLISKRQIVHGACGIVTKDFSGSIVSNEYSVLRCKPEIDLHYLGYLSHSIYFQQTCFHSSIGVHIEKMIFKLGEWFNWPINIPSLPEQKKIAAFLGVVDAKIAALRDRVAGLERYKRGLMQALFSQTLRFTKPDGTPFPDWEDKRLEQLSKEKFSNGVFNDPEKVGSGYKLINVKDMYRDGIIESDKLNRVAISAAEFNKNKVEYGDIFFTRSSLVKEGIAHSNIFLETCGETTFDGHLIRLRPDTEVVAPKFLYYMLGTNDMRRQLVARGKTGTMTTIGQDDIASVRSKIPHPDEQQKIADALSAMDAKIACVSGQLGRMQAFKKGLLQQMFV